MTVRNTSYKYALAVDDVVRNTQNLPFVDCLNQWAHILIEERYITETIQKRYEAVDGFQVLSNVQDSLTKAGHRQDIFELLNYYGAKYHTGLLAESVKNKIAKASDQESEILRLFMVNYSLHEEGIRGAYDPTGFLWSSAIALNISQQSVEDTLIRIGVVNPYYYKSKRHQHPAWHIAQYVHHALMDSILYGSGYRIAATVGETLRSTLEDANARRILDHVMTWDYGWPEYAEKQQLISELGGDENFRQVIGRLTRVGAIALKHDDDNGDAFYITPEAMALL